MVLGSGELGTLWNDFESDFLVQCPGQRAQ